MWQSQVIKGWKDEGRQEGALARQRSNLLKLVRSRLSGALPPGLAQQIEQERELATLERWFDQALAAGTPEALLQALGKAPPAPTNGAAPAP
jgi:hypothetical protein